nr:MAG TPA: YecR-like lipoprotein [Caudoviricetes sp.]
MKKLFLTFALTGCATVLVGCATSAGLPMQVVGGNRSAGIVNVGFYHQGAPLLDGGEDADWTSAPYIAEQTCKKWGYAGAEQLNQLAHTQGFFNGYGFLLRGTVYQEFQCISNQPIARP